MEGKSHTHISIWMPPRSRALLILNTASTKYSQTGWTCHTVKHRLQLLSHCHYQGFSKKQWHDAFHVMEIMCCLMQKHRLFVQGINVLAAPHYKLCMCVLYVPISCSVSYNRAAGTQLPRKRATIKYVYGISVCTKNIKGQTWILPLHKKVRHYKGSGKVPIIWKRLRYALDVTISAHGQCNSLYTAGLTHFQNLQPNFAVWIFTASFDQNIHTRHITHMVTGT